MKTLRNILAILTIMMALPTAAQTTIVKGILIDSLTQESVPYATVRVFKAKKTDKPVAMSLTDMDGHFNQQVKGNGQFTLTINSVGYRTVSHTFTATGNTIDLGTLLASEESASLGGVEVVAQKPLVKMETDRMTYNVAEDEDSKTYTVLDMLRKVPMVTVDGQDNITVNGQSSFKVYVDGKPNAMFSSNASMIFKNMPASAVKNIEVITNPGAAYDAEGTAGVLNIVMNKTPEAQASLNGYNATIRANAGTKSWGAGAFASGQQGKLSYSANAMYSYQKPGATDVTMEQERMGNTLSAASPAGQTIITNTTTETKLPFVMGSLNMGYDIDSLSSMNLMLSVTNFSTNNPATLTTNMLGGTYGNGFQYTQDMTSKNRRTSFTGSIDYQHFFNAQRTSSMAITYQLNTAPTHTEQWSTFNVPNASASGIIDLTNRYSDNSEHTTEHVLQTDFTTPLSSLHKVNFGVKLTLRSSESDAKYYLNDIYTESMSMDYSHNNSIGAIYAEYDGHAGNIGFKAGLRYEHTWQKVEYRLGNTSDFNTNYGNLVPSASLSYTLAPTSNIGLTYNMRISRPGISYLNPYVDRSNPTSISYGNPELDVEKTHNIGLVYNMYDPKLMLNAKLTHSLCDNAIEQYSFYKDNILNTTFANSVKRNITSLSLFASWMPAKNTRIIMNSALSYSDLRSEGLNVSNNGWQANAMAGIQQTLPADLKLSLFAITSTKSYTLQGWSSGFNLLTGSLTRSFLNDKLTVGVQGILGLSGGGNLKIENYSQAADFTNHTLIKVPISSVSLNVSFTFGNSKKQQKVFQSRVESDYMENQSTDERINSIGQQ